MKRLAILGAGTGGTILANRARRALGKDWEIVVVDPNPVHLYQPGLLFLPFGARDEHKDVRHRKDTLADGVVWRQASVEAIDAEKRTCQLSDGTLSWDLLVIASGCRIRPDMLEGLLDERIWGKSAHEFYTLSGAEQLRESLATFEGGRLVVNIVEMPIKCPVAPLEFVFLADEFFTKKGIRDRVEIVFATPLDGAFTKPVASQRLGYLLEEKRIVVEKEFAAASVDGSKKTLRSFDERELPFDMLVSIPTHTGAAFVETSGLGNELAFVPTEQRTLRAKGHERIFVLGDATDVPASKAGSVAHFEAELLVDNLVRVARGEEPLPTFDGHANCFVETGFGKAMLIDFNYDTQPLPGRYPTAAGPFSLLEESRVNHLGKLAFRWMYWHGLLPGRPMPVPATMSMTGKRDVTASP
jgi:sulfide:quinone oxidoreductase